SAVAPAVATPWDLHSPACRRPLATHPRLPCAQDPAALSRTGPRLFRKAPASPARTPPHAAARTAGLHGDAASSGWRLRTGHRRGDFHGNSAVRRSTPSVLPPPSPRRGDIALTC